MIEIWNMLSKMKIRAPHGHFYAKNNEKDEENADTVTNNKVIGTPSSNFLMPVLLADAVGRSGTTLLMSLLGSSQRIVFERTYPFETRYLTYLTHLSSFLSRAEPGNGDWTPDAILKAELSSLMPFPHPSGGLFPAEESAVAFRSRCFIAVWKEFSSVAIENAMLNGCGANTPIYYAEKTPRWCHDLLRNWIPIRGIYLLRDPRDVLLSALAFDKKRNHSFLSPRDGQPLAELVLERVPIIRDRLQRAISFKNTSNPDREMLVRYEDLVTDLDTTAERIGSWLSIELDSKLTIRNSGSYLEKHSTSLSAKTSIMRWKKELPRDVNDIYIQHLGAELVKLGYDLE